MTSGRKRGGGARGGERGRGGRERRGSKSGRGGARENTRRDGFLAAHARARARVYPIRRRDARGSAGDGGGGAPSRLTTTGSATAARVMTRASGARARDGRGAAEPEPPAGLRRRSGARGRAVAGQRSRRRRGCGATARGRGGLGDRERRPRGGRERARGAPESGHGHGVCGGRCVRASSANDSARRGTFTARERRGRAQFTGRLWTARGARRRKMNGAPPRGASSYGEIRRPCDPSVRRARRDGAAEDHALRRCVRARASRTRARIPDRDRPNDPTRGSDRSIPSPPNPPVVGIPLPTNDRPCPLPLSPQAGSTSKSPRRCSTPRSCPSAT